MIKITNAIQLVIKIYGDEFTAIDIMLREIARKTYKVLRGSPSIDVEIKESYCMGDYSMTLREGPTRILEPGDIDRKFEISARSLHSNTEYTQAHGVFFKAEDSCLIGALRGYLVALQDKGADPYQIEAVRLLTDRVMAHQDRHGSRLPDVNLTEEPYLFEGEGPSEPQRFAHLANTNTKDRQALLDIQALIGDMTTDTNSSLIERIDQILEDALKTEEEPYQANEDRRSE